MSAPQQQAPRTVEEVQALVAEELARVQESRRQEERSLPREPLFWLAVVEHWTQPLFIDVAQRLLDWKAPRAQGFLHDLEQRGWLRRIEAARRGADEARFALLTLQRDVAERQIQERLETGRDRALWDRLAALIDALQDAISRTVPSAVPGLTRRWTELAAPSITRRSVINKVLKQDPYVESWKPSADELEQRIEASLSSGMPGQSQRWLEAAQPLASLLARTLDIHLDVALRRSALRLELYHRRRHDLKHLEHFLERDDQIDALDQLIRQNAQDPNTPWAMHLLGGGGVGKTMLVRYLTGQLADAASWNLSIGRVDFDFLNPDYPRRSPGLLLWAFAQELRVFDTSGRVGQAFDDSERVLRQLHDQLQAGEGPESLLEHPLLHEGIEMYAQALAMLPQPVVFVIDTCEELTKPRAGVDGQFNVEATFSILEALHARMPTLRVVFAGRRPLAEAGFDWTCPSCSLPPRPFLRLFEMRGFSEAEAWTYLQERGVPSNLVKPVVQRSSPDSGGAVEIRWNVGQGPEDIVRCNPYELHFYAEWALDEPPPSPEDIETAGGHRYVELRILRRLGHGPLEFLLPLLGLARHADEALLQSVSGLDGQAFEDLLRELENQEWMELRSTASTNTSRRIYSVEEGLRLRLLSYCREHAGALEAQRQLAADALSRRVLEGDPAELDGSDLDAALRVMESEPDADLWWRDVEARLFAERDAEWVAQQASYLVGPEGAAALPDDASWPELRTTHPLRPAVLATFALAESRQPGGGLTPWMEVAETAENLPNIGADLTLRARAMVLAAQHVNGFDLMPGDAWDLWRTVAKIPAVPTPETVAALVAAAEAIVEHYEEHRRTPGTEKLLLVDVDSEVGAIWFLYRHFSFWANEADPTWKQMPWAQQIKAMLIALDGRVMARLGEQSDEATERFHKAHKLAAGLDESPSLQAWSPPDDFFTRIKLEAMRALYPRVLSADDCLHEFGAKSPAEGIEWDRFLSQLAELALALGPSSEISEELLAEKADDPAHPMHCRAHIEIPPFAVRRAQLLAASGEVEKALRALQDILRQAASLDTTVVQHAARAQLDLGIRLRLLDDASGFSLADSPDPDDHDLLDLGDALGHPPMKRKAFSVQDTRRVMHGHWRTLLRPTAEDCQEAAGTAQHRWRQIEASGEDYDVIDAHLVLDGWEATMLDEEAPGSAKSSAPLNRRKVMSVVESALRTSRHPEERWRLCLRQRALSHWQEEERDQPGSPIQLGGSETSLVERLGSRRAARMAWREADLLALRMPAVAAPLFGLARWLFEQSGDTLSEAICLTAQTHCQQNHPRAAAQMPSGLNDLKHLWQRLGAGLDTDAAQLEPHLRPWWTRAQLLDLRLGSPFKGPADLGMLKGVDEPMLTWLDDDKTSSEEPDASLSKSAEPSWDEHTGAFDVGMGTPDGFGMDGGGGSAPDDLPEGESTGALPPPSPPAPVSKPERPQTLPSPLPMAPSQTPETATPSPWWQTALPALIAGAGLAVAGGILVAVLLLASVLWQTHPAIPLVLLIVGLRALAGSRSLLRLVAPLRGYLGRKTTVHLQISDVPRAWDPDIPAVMSMKAYASRTWLGRTQTTPASDSILSRDALTDHQVSYADRLDSDLSSAILELPPLKSGDLIVLELGFGEAMPWEGVLAPLILHGSLRFRRSVPKVDWPQNRSRDSKAVYFAGPSRRSVDSVFRGLRRLEDVDITIRSWDFTETSSALLENPREEPVAHLLGIPIESSAGYRWRLQTRSDSSIDLQAQDLPKIFPQLSLLVLQENPAPNMYPRSAADRRQADYLRAFATEVQRAGIPALLTLPHMPPGTASRCAEDLAKLLVPYPMRMPTAFQEADPSLLDTVEAIRRHIRNDPNVDDEAAWDVVLYSPPGWRNPFQ